MRQHLEVIKERTGVVPEDLNIPEIPSSFIQIWNWFMRLSNQRQSGMSANPLSYSDINAFFNLIDVEITEEELNIILLLDRIVLDHYAEEQKKMEKRTK